MTRRPSPPPLVLDVGAAALCVVAMLVELVVWPKHSPDGWAPVAIVVMALPVLTRSRWPGASMTAAMVAILVVVSPAAVYVTVPFPAVLCGYTLAARHGRRVALLAAAGGLPAVLAILTVHSPHSLVSLDTGRNLALVVLPLALGVAAHDRRAYTAALVARAESAERSREEETRRRVGEERLRIARDVHDLVAHTMVAINVQAGVGAHLLERDPEQARATLRDIKRVSGEALGDLRGLLGLLRDEDLPDAAPVRPVQGLDGIADLRDGLASAGVEVDVRIDPAVVTLPAAVGATGYRIVQEALTNVMRHAGPTSARVRVGRRDDDILIEVEDDGGRAPVPLRDTGSGHGLRGMRERAAAAGGSLEAGPRDGGGWRVTASLPAGAAPVSAKPVSAKPVSAEAVSAKPVSAEASLGPVS